MKKKILSTIQNTLLTILIFVLIFGVMEGDRFIFGKQYNTTNMALLLIFILISIYNLYKQIKVKKFCLWKSAVIAICSIGIATVLSSVKLSQYIKQTMSNTIVYYSDKACFNFDHNCVVNIENKIVHYQCRPELYGVMKIRDGVINIDYYKNNIVEEFEAVYFDDDSNEMIVQYQITPNKYISINLKPNKGHIGRTPHRSCEDLIGPLTKTYMIDL